MQDEISPNYVFFVYKIYYYVTSKQNKKKSNTTSFANI